jgi:Helix-turn-helix domain
VTGEQASFGLGLRRERERRQIGLATVSATTKIKQSLLASLERGDLTHWPGGIYGRAFLREYAAAVGLPPESVLAEFLRLFPEPGVDAAETVAPPDPSGECRLTLAREQPWPSRTTAKNGLAAFVDASLVLAVGAAAGRVLGVGVWAPIAVIAIVYYSAATTLVGGSPMLWLMGLTFRVRAIDPVNKGVPLKASSRGLLHMVAAAGRQPQTAVEADFSDVVESVRIASR